MLVEYHAHDNLHTVVALLFVRATFGFLIPRAEALKVGVGQIIQQQRPIKQHFVPIKSVLNGLGDRFSVRASAWRVAQRNHCPMAEASRFITVRLDQPKLLVRESCFESKNHGCSVLRRRSNCQYAPCIHGLYKARSVRKSRCFRKNQAQMHQKTQKRLCCCQTWAKRCSCRKPADGE